MDYICMLYSLCSLCIFNDLKPHLLNHCQIIIKGAPSLQCYGNGISCQRMIACSPMTRATTHCYSCENDGLTTLGSTFDTVSDNYRWRRHNHFEAILDCLTTLEEQDILCTGADIDGQDANRR